MDSEKSINSFEMQKKSVTWLFIEFLCTYLFGFVWVKFIWNAKKIGHVIIYWIFVYLFVKNFSKLLLYEINILDVFDMDESF